MTRRKLTLLIIGIMSLAALIGYAIGWLITYPTVAYVAAILTVLML